MANGFRPWIDDANVTIANVQAGAEYSSDSQRSNGFAAGIPASSIRVNTALREATLVATALVNLLGSAGNNFDAMTTLADMETALGAYFGQDVAGLSYDQGTQSIIVSFKNGGSQSVYLPAGTVWYDGTDIVYNSLDDYFALSKSSYPNLHIGDYYLITDNYNSYGANLSKGDIFKVVYDNPASAEMQFVMNLKGSDASVGGHTFTIIEQNAVNTSMIVHKADNSIEYYSDDSFTKTFNNVLYIELAYNGSYRMTTNKTIYAVDDTAASIFRATSYIDIVGTHKYNIYCDQDVTLTF